jgi:2-phospho-L-lactate/phosphoenolpyruvate guanylyltransferase
MGATEQMKTAAVIPVKRLDAALGRLTATLSAPSRKRLAEAMFLDLLTKIRRSQTIDEVLVVTADPSVERNARWLGHRVLLQGEDVGHAPAASAGAGAVRQSGFDRVVMLPIDCPLFDPAELDDHLGRTPRAAMIVPDRHGSGTNALVLSPPDAFTPAFGPDSCARHVSRARAAGISFALERIESLEIDLDSADDLRELRDALILDPQPAYRTAQILWDLGAETEPAVA